MVAALSEAETLGKLTMSQLLAGVLSYRGNASRAVESTPAVPHVLAWKNYMDDPPKETAKFIDVRLALVVLVVVVGLVFAQLYWVLRTSYEHYGEGIRVLTAAAAKGANPNAVARRIFLLASGEQITVFKAAAFGVSALLALIGGVFILNGASAAYNLGLSDQPGKSGISATLQTTSPGLVIVTLAMALAAFAVHDKSSLQDQTDWDLDGRPPMAAPSEGAHVKPVTQQIDELVRELEARNGAEPADPGLPAAVAQGTAGSAAVSEERTKPIP